MVLELVIQKNTVVLRFFFLKIKQSPKPTAVVGLCAYRLLLTGCLINEDVREEKLFNEEAMCSKGWNGKQDVSSD